MEELVERVENASSVEARSLAFVALGQRTPEEFDFDAYWELVDSASHVHPGGFGRFSEFQGGVEGVLTVHSDRAMVAEASKRFPKMIEYADWRSSVEKWLAAGLENLQVVLDIYPDESVGNAD